MQIAGYKVSEASLSLVPECLSLMRTVRKSGVGMTGMGEGDLLLQGLVRSSMTSRMSEV